MGTRTSSSTSQEKMTPSASTLTRSLAPCCALFRTQSQVGAPTGWGSLCRDLRAQVSSWIGSSSLCLVSIHLRVQSTLHKGGGATEEPDSVLSTTRERARPGQPARGWYQTIYGVFLSQHSLTREGGKTHHVPACPRPELLEQDLSLTP